MFQKFFIVCILSVLTQSSAFGATIYNLVDLGTLGGTNSEGIAINDFGQVTGASQIIGNSNVHAFFWNGSSMQDLGTIDGTSSFGRDINNNGDIVGYANSRAFRWTSSTGLSPIDAPNAGRANDLNESGQAIGSRTPGASTRTLLWSPSNAVTNPYPALNTAGVAMNNNGEFVGTNPAGFFSPSSSSPFQAIPVNPTDINDSRLITGSNGSNIAMLYDFDSSSSTIIGKLLPTDPNSFALGLNNAGTVVGVSGNAGFVYDSTMGLQSLTSLLHPSFSGWTILAADDINNHGQIVGIGNFNGQNHAVIMNAVPEPNSSGDFDGDGDVDGADFVAWQTNFPKPSGATLADGDADGDGDVDGADLVVWQTHFSNADGPGPDSAPVPEPAARWLALLAAMGGVALVRRRSFAGG